MSLTFTKLFSSITESTVWVEPYPTRIAWVALLANCDKRGEVYASVPGFAKLAGITLPEAEAALHCFMSPDRYSRTKEHDGRRIEEIDGGWRLLNHEKYRELRSAEERREYQREWDRQNRGKGAAAPGSDSKSDSSVGIRRNPTHTDTDTDSKSKPLRAADAALGGFDRFWGAWPSSPRKVAKAACRKKWEARGLDKLADAIVAHVETMKRSDQWKRGFEPAPLTYVNQSRWDDGDPGEDPPGEKPWFLTSTGIESKAKGLGLTYDDVEPWPEFRNRVFAKAGVTHEMFEDARRQWQT